MRSMLVGFRFIDDPEGFSDPQALVVRIPRGLRSRRGLFEILKRELRLPAYFGDNWDALEECLRDLGWLREPRRIVLVHESIPFADDAEKRATYLKILRDSIAEWKAEDPHEILAVFPGSSQPEIKTILSQPGKA